MSLLIIWWQWPIVVGAGVENFAAVSLLKVSPCDPRWFACPQTIHLYPPRVWAGNSGELRRLQERLSFAHRAFPQDQGVTLRLAETYFALGDRAESAALIPPLPSPVWKVETNHQHAVAPPSPLLDPGRVEGEVVAAYQQAADGRWDSVARSMQEALARGAEYLRPPDLQLYQGAIAERFAAGAIGGLSARSAYLAGKHFFLAGDVGKAELWLKQAQSSPGWNALQPAERAGALVYLGMVYEQRSELHLAQSAYEEAVSQDASAAVPKLALLGTLSKLGDTQAVAAIQVDLGARGPTYPLGQSGVGNPKVGPGSQANGWRLIGYDADEETVATGGLVDLWLWWQSQAPKAETKQSPYVFGHWYVQHEFALNLAPNPSFAWGTYPNGFPAGYETEPYAAPPGSTRVAAAVDPYGDAGDVLQMTNDMSRSVGIVSLSIPADPSAVYLLAGWKREQTIRQGQIGLSCDDGGTYYVASRTPTEVTGAWTRFAGAVTPGAHSAKCSIFLAAFADSGSAELTDLFLVRLQPPAQGANTLASLPMLTLAVDFT